MKILDEKHLAIPDRPGNRRADTFGNPRENPYLAMLFMIPGKAETVRVSGECRIVRDQVLRESMAVNGRIPDFAVVAWPDASGTAVIVEAMVKHANVTQEEFLA